jgi:NADH-quinone oxidoreductase subunit J
MTWVVFVVAAVAAVISAVGVVMARNAVHSALMLVGTLFSVAVLFVLQEAHFLAAVQVIVYAGAIVVLFLFVIMLLGVDQDEALNEPLRFQRPIAVGLGVAALGSIALALTVTLATGQTAARGPGQSAPEGNVEALASSLFTDFIWPFEITSALLVIAVVGAIVLVGGIPRKERAQAAPQSGEDSEEESA